VFTARPSHNLRTVQSQVTYYQVIASGKPRYVCGPPTARDSFQKYLTYVPPSERRTMIFVYYWRTVKFGEQYCSCNGNHPCHIGKHCTLETTVTDVRETRSGNVHSFTSKHVLLIITASAIQS